MRSSSATGLVNRPRTRLGPLRDQLARGLWVVPLVGSIAALALALVIVHIDRHTGPAASSPFAYQGDPSGAMSVLGTIATAVLSFTGLVFSIVIVALQLASSQYSPRVMRTFLRDRGTQVTLAIFVSTFVYTIAVLQSVRAGTGTADAFVPGNAVTVAIALSLVTIGAFVYFVHHMADSIRVTSIIESVAAETRQAIEVHFPPPVPAEQVATLRAEHGRVTRAQVLEDLNVDSYQIGAPRPGVVTDFNVPALTELGSHHDLVIELLYAVGDYVAEGAPLVRIHVDSSAMPPADTLWRHIGIAPERTMDQDVAFGFRQLVDIAERALSPAVNDPTTAVQALDRIHDLLRRLALRPFPTGVYHDRSGNLRLVAPIASWPELVVLSFSEIRFYGEGSVQISRRLLAILEDLNRLVSPDRRMIVDEMLGEWSHSIDRGFTSPVERARARVPDAGGLGSDDTGEVP